MSALSVIGIVLLVTAGILFFLKRNQASRAFSLKAARSVTAAELHNTAQGVAQEIGGGNWRDYIKLWGQVQVSTPLSSPLNNTPCVYYDSKVIRVYEETVTSSSSSQNGQSSRRRQRRTETISQNVQSVPFTLVDNSGTVEIDPDGAKVEAEQILDEFRPGNASGGQLRFGKFSLSLGANNSSTLGYRYVESVLPVNRNVLVVGGVSDATGNPVVGKPINAGQRKFIISLKNDERLTEAATRAVKRFHLAMVICAGLGVILLLVGFVI